MVRFQDLYLLIKTLEMFLDYLNSILTLARMHLIILRNKVRKNFHLMMIFSVPI